MFHLFVMVVVLFTVSIFIGIVRQSTQLSTVAVEVCLTPDESVVKKKVRLANRQLFCSCFFVFLMIFAKLLLSVVYFYSKNRRIYYSNLLVFSFSSLSTH